MAPRGKMIELKAHDRALIGCYLVRAAGARRGGLVLIQEIFGVTGHIKDLCDRYADEGYDVIAPSLYDRQQRGFQASYAPEDIQQAVALRDMHRMEDSVADVQMAINMLKGQGATPVFAVGYCYGGSVAWVASSRCEGLAAASGYYGRLIADHIGETPRCPMILHFGRSDATIPMADVERIAARHPAVPVHIYEAGHGFISDRRSDYHPESAALARQRTLELFRANGG